MGNCLSVTCFSCGPTCSISNQITLDEIIDDNCCRIGNIQILREKMGRLSASKRDVERQINDNRDRQVEVSHVVIKWLEQVAKLDDEVSKLGDKRACCFLCSKNKSGILSRIKRVNDLLSQKDNWEDSIFMPRHRTADKDSIFIRPSADANIVGMEDMMSQVLRYLDDATVGVVGIHGMGGAGKTTLAKQLKRKLQFPSSSPSTSAAGGQGSRKFDDIVWAVVSQNLDIRNLQRDIAAELGISGFKDEEDESIRAHFISSYLLQRRFLLVLDDVWKEIDLTSIGIPEIQDKHGSKIVLTTREEKVCTKMGARKSTVKVGCLGEEESWELFKKTIQWADDEFEEKHVYKIARDIVSKCGGLPLALITIARAMATKSDISLWRSAYESLKDSPQSIEGMEDVYRLLEFSYNSLKKEEYKSCLLYSALFPEDREISIGTMVDYCIGGGSVSGDGNMSCDIVRLRDHGRFIISELIDACLLERGKDKVHVKVHDAIRDMILFWLKRDNGESRIISHAGKDIRGTHVIDVQEWRAASMLSFYRNPRLQELVIEGGKEDNRLQVLLLNSRIVIENVPYKLPKRLFEYCALLHVLDLSGRNLRDIPESLCCLKFLRYLNLSRTKIQTLPKEMRKLSSLIQLNLSFTLELDKIPNGLFSSLSKLQSLDMLQCRFFAGGKNCRQVLKEISDLHLRKGVPLTIHADVVKFLVDECHSLSNSITCLEVIIVDRLEVGIILKWIESRLKKLKSLRITGDVAGDCKEDLVIDDGHFSELEALSILSIKCCHIILKGQALEHLTTLSINSCDKLTDVACLWKLPNLEELSIQECDGIVELMEPSQPEGDEIIHNQSFLPKLKYISLTRCTNLLRISSGPLQLLSLQNLSIDDCPSLKDISMISSSQKLEIICKAKWWEDLHWENSGGVPPSNFMPNFFFDRW